MSALDAYLDAAVQRLRDEAHHLLTARTIGLSHSAAPADEVDAPEYARMPFHFEMTPAGLVGTEVLFPKAKTDWGRLSHILLFDAQDAFVRAFPLDRPTQLQPMTAFAFTVGDIRWAIP